MKNKQFVFTMNLIISRLNDIAEDIQDNLPSEERIVRKNILGIDVETYPILSEMYNYISELGDFTEQVAKKDKSK